MTNAVKKKDNQEPAFTLKGLSKLTASEYLTLRRKKEITATGYVQECIAQIETYEDTLHAWSYFDKERLLDLAVQSDQTEDLPEEKRELGFDGRFWGVPVGVKDVFNTKDMPTEHGSSHFRSYTPGNDARVITSLKREGALMAGKTVTAELAVHTPGKTKNPYDTNRTPGTSSSGSAVAVATGMVPVALASQTAGSTIRPASFCGIYGFKPSFGSLPRTAMLKTTDSLDSVSVMARSVDDVGIMFDIMRVKDMNYPIIHREYKKMERLSIGNRPWRVGFVSGPMTKNRHLALQPQMDSLRQTLENAGCEVMDFTLPEQSNTAHEHHDRIYNKSLSYYFKREWHADSTKFTPKMAQMIEGGLATEYADYNNSLEFQSALAKQLDQDLEEQCDILIDVAANDEAPLDNDLDIPSDHNLIYTMTLVSALSMPLFKGENGLPIGAQLIARRFDDYKLLYFAKYLEEQRSMGQ